MAPIQCYMEWEEEVRNQMQGNKWEMEEDKKICYLDIDGVLNDYPECWLNFLKARLSSDSRNTYVLKDLNRAKNNIPYQVYKDLKWEYRESGYKEDIISTPNASKVTGNLRAMGYHICIITSRPVKQHPSLFKQTVNWLNKNNIRYDDLIFDEDKHISILKRYPHLDFGVEDHRYYANLVADWGYKMYLLDNKYNQGEIHKNVTRINSLVEISERTI